MSKGVKRTSNKYADEGSAAHTLAETAFKDGKNAVEYQGQTMKGGEGEYKVTEEMVDAVQIYLDFVRGYVGDGITHAVEQRVDLKHYDRRMVGMFGTADFVSYNPGTKTLLVADLKYGAGVPVEVVGNDQGLYYGLGALVLPEFGDMPVSLVRLAIVQPRCPHQDGPVRTWDIAPVDLLDWADKLRRAAECTKDPASILVPGDHCKFCPAKPPSAANPEGCPSLRNMAMENAQAAFSSVGNVADTVAPKDLTPDQLARVLTNADAIMAWVKSVQEYAHVEAQNGNVPSGYKLVQKRATRKWTDPDGVRDMLQKDAQLSTVDIMKPSEIRTPPQMEAVLKKHKKDKSLLEPYITKVSSGTTLVPTTDRRAVVDTSAQAAFSPIAKEE